MGTVRMKEAVPEPGDHHSSSFAQAGWDVDQPRLTRCSLAKGIDVVRFCLRVHKPAGIDMGTDPQARCSAKDLTKIQITHRKNGFWRPVRCRSLRAIGREHEAIIAIKL